jgi:hypothetical protein
MKEDLGKSKNESVTVKEFCDYLCIDIQGSFPSSSSTQSLGKAHSKPT